jgi:hypothetical protein
MRIISFFRANSSKIRWMIGQQSTEVSVREVFQRQNNVLKRTPVMPHGRETISGNTKTGEHSREHYSIARR